MSQAQRLVEAAESNDIEALYRLLRENPYLLEEIDRIPFADTPLHLAAASGSTHFAIEVLNLKPSFGQKLNPDGLSPMQIALISGKPQTVRRLLDYDSDLIRVRGKESCTSLHFAAQMDDYSQLLAQFLVANKESIQDLNIREESAVHVAVKSGNLNAFKVLLRWIQYTDKLRVLDWKDEDDNGALHIAVAMNNYEMVRLLIPHVKLNMLNKDGLTALDIAKGFPNTVADARKIEKKLLSAGAKTSVEKPLLPHMGNLAQYMASSSETSLSKEDVYFEAVKLASLLRNMSGKTRNNLFVVGALIITVTYQAVLSPPGGLTSGDNCSCCCTNGTKPAQNSPAGKANMGKDRFVIYLIFNTLPFIFTMLMMVMLLPKSKLFFVYYSLPLVALSVCYGLSAGLISPAHSDRALKGLGTYFGASVLIVVFLIKGLCDRSTQH